LLPFAEERNGVEMILWFLISTVLAALAPLFPNFSRTPAVRPAMLPAPYRSMKELPLSGRDRRFAADFPGSVHRLTDGAREYIIRRVDEPTRKLHPAEHCFRGSGYRIAPAAGQCEASGCKSCFTAESKSEAMKVCQQIFNEHGDRWSDVSSWYWSAWFGRSKGPWWAVTEIARQ
jgi:hypothetical protein